MSLSLGIFFYEGLSRGSFTRVFQGLSGKSSQVDAHVSARLFYYESCPLWTETMGPDEEKLVRQSKSCTCMAHAIYAIVKKTMVHKCSVGYCKDSEVARCFKYFPKRLTQVTYSDHRIFPLPPYPS